MQILVAETSLSKTLTSATDKKLKSIVDDINKLLKTAETNEQHSAAAVPKVPAADSCINQTSTPPNHTPYPGISQVLPTLFLCGASAAAVPSNLDKLGVSCVINIAPELPDTPLSGVSKPLYLRFNVQDRPEVDLSVHFDEVADTIEQVRQNGGKSLVHCVAGCSRSAALCIAYLMKHADMSLRTAYYHVKAIRPQIRPNSGFFQQLRRYEVQLRGCDSVHMVFFESLNKEIPDVLEPEYRAMEDFYQRYRSSLKKR